MYLLKYLGIILASLNFIIVCNAAATFAPFVRSRYSLRRQSTTEYPYLSNYSSTTENGASRSEEVAVQQITTASGSQQIVTATPASSTITAREISHMQDITTTANPMPTTTSKPASTWDGPRLDVKPYLNELGGASDFVTTTIKPMQSTPESTSKWNGLQMKNVRAHSPLDSVLSTTGKPALQKVATIYEAKTTTEPNNKSRIFVKHLPTDLDAAPTTAKTIHPKQKGSTVFPEYDYYSNSEMEEAAAAGSATDN